MLKFSKNLFLGIVLALIIIPTCFNKAEASGDTVYFFYGDGCPHCAKEEMFLDSLKKQDASLDVEYIEVWNNIDNRNLLITTAKTLGADVDSIPFTLVGEKYVSGFNTAETTGIQIKSNIDICKAAGDCIDVVTAVRNNDQEVLNKLKNKDKEFVIPEIPEKLNVPFIGEVNVKTVSLPVLTIVMGLLDGFNPCAMWVLVFLIGLLIGMENKRRRWTLGIVFLVASAAVYYIFMAAWLNLLLFLGVVIWVRLVIGLLALGGGAVNIREYFKNPNAACKVTQPTKRKLIFNKLKEITLKQQLWLALGGIIILAFAVNLVELICSAGLPAVYTQVLALADLPTWQYYAYILLYILIFLIDDIIVFIVAMVTLEITGLSSKYSRYSSLIGGIIMLIIGILLIFRPEWLMFG